MEDKSICLSIRFKGDLNQVETILFFIELFKNKFNKIFEEFHYTITDKTKFNWKQKTRGGKFTSNNLNKFKDFEKQSNDKIKIDFEMLTNLKNYTYKSRDIDISISYSQVEEIKSLNFIFNSAWISQTFLLEFVQSTVLFLNNQNSKIIYGYALELPNVKMPAFYIQGISNGELHNDEEERLNLWSSSMSSCESKILDIFWGNIVSSKHIHSVDTLVQIQKIVGKENAILLLPNLIWFNLSEPMTNFNILENSTQSKKLFEYFKSNDLILSLPESTLSIQLNKLFNKNK